ncbi:hypothetical protein TGMAS_260205 [Toxoplasma gondii MAS]|uniref:Transmembrane protein n=1 Tax=Toxoplasma gondii MAS TaxID=943118 RepID=A0A086QRJ2_TOXGO|nr:hypothetical protein TGMAS_260205 [Toxoplasma gondii MAS]
MFGRVTCCLASHVVSWFLFKVLWERFVSLFFCSHVGLGLFFSVYLFLHFFHCHFCWEIAAVSSFLVSPFRFGLLYAVCFFPSVSDSAVFGLLAQLHPLSLLGVCVSLQGPLDLFCCMRFFRWLSLLSSRFSAFPSPAVSLLSRAHSALLPRKRTAELSRRSRMASFQQAIRFTAEALWKRNEQSKTKKELQTHLYLNPRKSVYKYTLTHIYTYLYIYREREREREIV